MAERQPSDSDESEENDERLKHLKQASRLIITSREKMPHSARWHLALRRTLWRYTQEVQLQQHDSRPTQAGETEDKNCDH